MSSLPVHGPVDVLVLRLPFGGRATADAVLDLVDQAMIEVYDVMLVHRDEDGSCREVGLSGDPGHGLSDLRVLADDRSGLLTAADAKEAGTLLAPGSSALVLLYENLWAVPLVAAAQQDGAELVASTRLTARQVTESAP
jgi:hypothetical protein